MISIARQASGASSRLLALMLLSALALAACTTAPKAPPASAEDDTRGDASATELPADFPHARYRQPGQTFAPSSGSRVDILVRRTGALANLGHNHVITSAAVLGRLHWDGRTGHADLLLSVPALLVDNISARARHGDDFPDAPPEDAVAGTRANMLGAGVLAADDHPWLRARMDNIRMAADGKTLDMDLTLSIRGRTLQRPASATLLPNDPPKGPATDQGPAVEAKLTVSHGDLGLTPFSALGGAIRVADDIELHCVLVFRPV